MHSYLIANDWNFSFLAQFYHSVKKFISFQILSKELNAYGLKICFDKNERSNFSEPRKDVRSISNRFVLEQCWNLIPLPQIYNLNIQTAHLLNTANILLTATTSLQ